VSDGWREVEFTKHRQVVYDMLNRARRFHAPVSGSMEVDVTDARARIREERRAGRKVGMMAYLTRATALVVKEHPSLQRHLFTNWRGKKREVVFDTITCTLIVARKKADGELILLPLNIERPDEQTVEALHQVIQDARNQPLEQLEAFQSFEKVKRVPRPLLRLFSYKARSDPNFYRKYFGTYGLSSLMDAGGPGNAMATVANTAVAFLPSTIKERPWVVGKEIVPRTILNISAVFDHFLVDGGEIVRIAHSFRSKFEDPDRVLGAMSTRPADGE